MTHMQAVLCEHLGQPSVLRPTSIPRPQPGPGQLLIRVRAAGVNFPDVLMVRGGYQYKPELPFVPGLEVSGEIAAVGAGVTGWAIGERVMAGLQNGAFAEFAVAATDNLLRLPANWSFVEGAAFRVGAMTAHAALDLGGRLQAGETALIHGASGGMGLAAVQLAKHRGARVIATGSNDAKLAVVAKVGADHVVNLGTGDWVKSVKALTDGRGVDVVYDPIGGEVLARSISAAAPGGRLLVVGFMSGSPTPLPSNHILIKRLSVIGIRAGEIQRADPEMRVKFGEALAALLRDDRMRPHVSLRVPLARSADALDALLARGVVGKAVVEVG